MLLAHPGGPFWASKDRGAWTIPKGLVEEGEVLLDAARREFAEETGGRPEAEFVPLEPVRQPSGKWVHAFAVRGEFDASAFRSNTFTMEWPPRSGVRTSFPEVDRCAWMSIATAREKILTGQRPILDQLILLEQRASRSSPRGRP